MRTELRLRDQQRAWAGLPRPKASALRAQHSVLCFTLGALLLALCSVADAQQSAKVPRIGLLTSGRGLGSAGDTLRQGLRELGWVEGQNVAIESRLAEVNLDKLPQLATDLVQRKVAVIVS
jgi:putative ABC transport system substrate-binding protein